MVNCRRRWIKSRRSGIGEFTARRSREHNHCNVLCLGTDLLSEDQVRNIVEIFLNTEWLPGRHTERVNKVMKIQDE